MTAMVPITRSSLIKPLDDRAVLIPNEKVYYAERQHWASVAQPVYETMIVLLAVIWFVNRLDGDPGISAIDRVIFVVLVAAVLHYIYLWLNGSPPVSRLAVDPFSNKRKQSGPLNRWLFIGSLVLVFWQVGPRASAILAVVGVIARLITILAQWAYYERRYITNRRLIESGGFLGSRINSMPLSRVTDISFSRTIPAEIFGYAQMRIETAGQDQALGVVRYITQPDHFYEVLVNFSSPQAAGGA